ncbi:hypothetical protein C2E23DRAFT_723037 [Lenzites betulinus]|nr:hypothetical protein C2E23DRAFT_723037 [Lenzites betulinus]
MSFAAPVPRIPLGSVLRRLDASRAALSPDASVTAHHLPSAEATHTLEQGADLTPLGLGLMLGAAGMPIFIPRPQLELASQSPSRYSQRLRSIAPAPLQLASPTPRPPFRTLASSVAQTSGYYTPSPLSRETFTDAPLATSTPKRKSPLGAASVSPQSDGKVSISSAMASQSTAPTSLVFPGQSTNTNGGRSVDQSRATRSLSRSVNSPLSAFPVQSAFAGSSSPRKSSMRSPRMPGGLPARVPEDPFWDSYQSFVAPPPLRRTEWVPLPELTDEEGPSPISPSFDSLLNTDLRRDLGIEDLALRAENCSETIARASLSLCSCSLLRDPDAIMGICDRLRATFVLIQRALDKTPAEFTTDALDVKRNWYSKHWQIMASLDRNLNLFYLLAHQIEQRPPRIHRLASLVEKLNTYQAKFSDLARRITLSHEKLHFLGLRVQLSLAHASASSLHSAGEERILRHDGRVARQEGRTRRREIREEITRVRGRIRAIRDRDFLEDVAPNENSTPYDGDDDMDIGESGKWRR